MPRGRRRYQIEWILLSIALLTLGSLLGYSVYANYGEIEAMEGDRLQVQARVIAENLERQLVGVNNALVGVRDDLLQWNGNTISVAPSRRLKVLSDAMPGVRTLFIANADGTILDSNRRQFAGVSVADREAFKALRASADAASLHISPPFRTPLGVIVVNAMRVVAGARGEFAGVVAAALDPEYFNVLLRSVLYAPDMSVVVTHWDGKVFLSMPQGVAMVGLDLAKPGSFFSRHRESGRTATLLTSTSVARGDERMMASRTLERADLHIDKPLIIHVSRNLSAVFADWRRDAYQRSWMFGVLVLITTLGLILHQRRQRTYDRIEIEQDAARRHAEQALRQSEERYRSLIEWSPEPLAVHRSGKLIYVNPAAIKLFGAASAQDLVGKPILELIHPDFHQIVLARVKSIALGAASTPMIQERYLKLDGTEMDVEVQATSIIYDGEPAVQASLRDVTERKQAEAAVNMAAQRLQIALEGSQISVWETDLRTNQIWLDAAWTAFLGMPPGETRTNALELLQIVHPDDRHGISAAAVDTQKGKISSYAVEHRVRTADGEWKWIMSRGRVIERDAGGRPLRMSGTNTDITERKRLQDAKYESEARFRLLIEKSLAGMYVLRNAHFLYANPRLEEILGYGPGEMVGLNADQLVLAEDLPIVHAAREQLRTGAGSASYSVRVRRKDGATIELGVQSMLTDFEGAPATIGMAQDIGERSRAQAQIKHYIARLEHTTEGALGAVALMVEQRDPYTAGHERRVGDLAAAIGAEMGLPEETVKGLRLTGYVHDIGKIGVPAELLSKPTRLTPIEMQLIRIHAQTGFDVLKGVDFPWPVAEVILQHHERLDGSGYPRQLKGEQIIIEARIMSVADVVEAMSSHRPYRPGRGMDAALQEIEKNSGILYDQPVVAACLHLFRNKGYTLPA